MSPYAPTPWRYENRGQDEVSGRRFGDIVCAEGWPVAEYVYHQDAEAIIAAVHERHGPQENGEGK